MNFKNFVPLALASGCWLSPLSAMADYVVDHDLGVLPMLPHTWIGGSSGISTSSVGQPNNADYHNILTKKNTVLPTSTSVLGNWGHEIVYRFELDAPATLVLQLTSQTGADFDFLILKDLSTVNEFEDGSGKNIAESGLEFAALDPDPVRDPRPDVVLDGLDPGVYYLVAEVWDGFDPDENDPPLERDDGSFVMKISRYNGFVTNYEFELGNIATSLEPFVIDTFGSAFDTELAIYDDTGNLLAVSDDDLDDATASVLSFPGGLPTGAYVAVVAPAGTAFPVGPYGFWEIASSPLGGDFRFRYSRGPTLTAVQLSGTLYPGYPARSVQLIEFLVQPKPPLSIEEYNPGLLLGYPDPLPLVDLGTIVAGLQPFTLDTLSSAMPDTELALFDSNGQLLLTNDDKVEPAGLLSCSEDPLSECRSELDLDRGLIPGTYWLLLTGFDKQFDHGFKVRVPSGFLDSYGGDYTLTYPGGQHSGTFLDSGEQWYRFQVGEAPGSVAAIDITTFQRPAPDEVILQWTSSFGQFYRLETSLGLDIWTPAITGVAGTLGSTTAITFSNLYSDNRFIRVRQDY